MYKTGDKIVYGQAGVMTVVDIREETVLSERKTYYVLKAVDAGEGALTFVPTDNADLVSLMRPLMSRFQIDKILSEVKASPDFIWIEDPRVRAQAFKKLLDSGNFAELLRMIKAVRERINKHIEIGKRSYISDEVIMNKAKKRIYSEFSAVLGLDYEETEKYVNASLE